MIYRRNVQSPDNFLVWAREAKRQPVLQLIPVTRTTADNSHDAIISGRVWICRTVWLG